MEPSDQVIEDLMKKFLPVMGNDFAPYRNHVYRVFTNCLLIDSTTINTEKYAIAAVYHDIGIWTNHTLDYLDPSAEQAKIYLTETDKQEWIEEITLMIYWHHKMTKYEGKHKELVENFRKADWIDISLGWMAFGFERQKINETRKSFPNLGFHIFLIKAIIKNLFKHPLRPLPMFRK